MAFMDTVSRFVAVNKYVLFIAVAKAAIGGAGLALAFLASIDIAIAVLAKETWDTWQVDQFINQFAATGAIVAAVWQFVKIVFFR